MRGWHTIEHGSSSRFLLLCICHSDLLKELRNPVHGDRSKADDVSWPFYTAIDEILGHDRATPSNDEYIDPHEFLCVSVTPEEPTSSVDALPAGSNPEIERRRNELLAEQRLRAFGDECSIQIERVPSTREATRCVCKRWDVPVDGKYLWKILREDE